MKKWLKSIGGILITPIPLFGVVACEQSNTCYFNVEFNTMGGSFINTVKVAKNELLSPPENEPQKEGNTFVGWCCDEQCSTPFDFTQPITSDLVLYAQWSPNEHDCVVDISTDGMGTLDFNAITVTNGTKWCDVVKNNILPKPTPNKGFTFIGWFKDKKQLQDTDSDKINSHWNIIARFIDPKTKKIVDFETDGHGTLSGLSKVFVNQDTLWSELVENNMIPTMNPDDGYQVIGFYKDEQLITPDTDFKINSNIVILAKFEHISPEPVLTYNLSVLNPSYDGYVIEPSEISANTQEPTTVNIYSPTDLNEDSLISVIINGQTVTKDFVLDTENKKHATITFNSGEINGDVSFLFQTPTAPVVDDFESDPWETIIYYANHGIDSILSAYKLTATDLIGKRRFISVNGVQHEVMVVGYNQDFTDAYRQKHATLTFKFNNVISGSDTKYIETIWANRETAVIEHETTYLTSKLSQDLDESMPIGNRNKKNLNSIITIDDKILPHLLKHVYKSFYFYNDLTDVFGIRTGKVTIFPLVMGNVFSMDAVNRSAIVCQKEKELILQESNEQYLYYQKEIGNRNIDFNTPYPCLITKDCNDTLCYSCFASLSYDENHATLADMFWYWMINKDGCFSSSAGERMPILPTCVAPCFCI